ncbi:hypothetical protein HYW75_07055 [Candidatus Pacearchaeota archaeon]|nr:hypothetical protein [Candidatus Pacearchaeota archaeon]
MVSLRYALWENKEGNLYYVFIGCEMVAKIVPHDLPTYFDSFRKINDKFKKGKLEEYERTDLIRKVNSTLNQSDLIGMLEIALNSDKFSSEEANIFLENVLAE